MQTLKLADFNFHCAPDKQIVARDKSVAADELAKINHLNLEDIRLRIIEKHELPCQLANEIIAEYRKFLYMVAVKSKNPRTRDRGISPPPLVDIAWHLHLLDSKRYAKDCQEVLGFFLNHSPIQFRHEAGDFDLTMQLYSDLFVEISFLWDQIFHGLADSCCGSHPPDKCCD